MEDLGYVVESGKLATQRIRRPVLFGDNGRAEVSYEIDAFHDELGIAVEVEAGRGAMGNADYRDIIRMSLLLDAEYMVLMTPSTYRYGSTSTSAFARTRDQLSAIYASDRLRLPFSGVLLIGY
jgi:outer membrane receptor for monomeric catechols